LIIILTAPKIFATVFWLAKARASHPIPAQAISADTSKPRFDKRVIPQIIQIKILITLLRSIKT
jgi:hypothetical protein